MAKRSDATTSPAAEAPLGHAERGTAHLVVVHSPDADRVGTRAPLSQELLLIGRDLQADGVVLQDPRVSRVHARLAFDARAGQYRIGDAQSRNGTFVNARRVETALLSDGDVVRAGDTLLVFQEGDAMAGVRERIAAVAPLQVPVLLRGETGTGKELLARALHEQSGRSGSFVALNCAAVPFELMSAELFGHTKGAFSGATQARKGVFAAADGGTLFLDEIGDCPLPVQAALLRALQEKAVRPLGCEREQPVDVRVIAATHADLEGAMSAGRFRPDLFGRLAQIVVNVPPLRERRTEILQVARECAQQAGRSLALTADAAEALLCWHWPFNVRELQSLVHTCLAQSEGTIGAEQLHRDFPELLRPVLDRSSDMPPHATSSVRSLDPRSDRQRLRALLEQHAGNVSTVAATLGKPRAQVYRWMKAMGLSPAKFRR